MLSQRSGVLSELEAETLSYVTPLTETNRDPLSAETTTDS